MKILIVEDEPLAAERLQNLLKSYPKPLEIAHWADSVRGAVAWLSANAPDLILLDIHLGDGLSFEVFEKTEVSSPVIFTTAFDQYAIRAFRANGFDYLLKPIQKEELHASLDRFFAKQTAGVSNLELDSVNSLSSMVRQEFKSRFLVKLGEKLITVPVGQIAYFYFEDRTMLLRTLTNRTYPISYTFEQLELLLDPAKFFRINRSCAVSVEAVESVVSFPGNRLELMPLARHTNVPFVVSRELCQAFKIWLDG